MLMSKKQNRKNVVKQGGVAREPAEVEDVTRDTYGYSKPQRLGKDRGKRLAEADRTAAAAGIPGVAVPEPATSRRSDDQARDEEKLRSNNS